MSRTQMCEKALGQGLIVQHTLHPGWRVAGCTGTLGLDVACHPCIRPRAKINPENIKRRQRLSKIVKKQQSPAWVPDDHPYNSGSLSISQQRLKGNQAPGHLDDLTSWGGID